MESRTDLNLEQRDGLIDRYLNDKLSAGERTAFELMLLEDPQLFERVQLLEAFKRSLADESAALTSKRELFALPFRAWLQQPLSLAASVLVTGLGLQVLYATFTQGGAAQGVGVGTVFVLEATRGSGQLALTGAAPYLFQIDAGPGAAGAEVAISLHEAGGAEVLAMDGLTVDANGWVRLVIRQPLAGAYTVELARPNAPGTQTFDLIIAD